jgi:hypothetical protein
METKKPGATAAAWSVAAVTALIVIALVAVPLITGTRLDGSSLGMVFIPLCFVLSVSFFRVAGDVQELREECRSLRDRLDGVRGDGPDAAART